MVDLGAAPACAHVWNAVQGCPSFSQSRMIWWRMLASTRSSKHNKTLVCIGSGKVIDNGAAGPAAAALTKTPPPSPPPSPGSSSRAEAKAEAKAEKAIAAAAAKEVKDAAKAEKAKVAAEQKV